jgi:hypothetical protein
MSRALFSFSTSVPITVISQLHRTPAHHLPLCNVTSSIVSLLLNDMIMHFIGAKHVMASGSCTNMLLSPRHSPGGEDKRQGHSFCPQLVLAPFPRTHLLECRVPGRTYYATQVTYII